MPIDPRLQALMNMRPDENSPTLGEAMSPENPQNEDETPVTFDKALEVLDSLGEQDQAVAAVAANYAALGDSEIYIGADGDLHVSDALRAAMQALVPKPSDVDIRDLGEIRRVGPVTFDPNAATHVIDTSYYFTTSHWHWLSARKGIRPIPAQLGFTSTHLSLSEAQIRHDLTAWSCLDQGGNVTDEAKELFGALTGSATVTLFGTVLLYAQKRAAPKLSPDLKKYGVENSVRNVPRVTFAIGVTEKKVVTCLLNGVTMTMTKVNRRGTVEEDGAAAILDVVDPQREWPELPMQSVTIGLSTYDALRNDPETSRLIDEDPPADADDETRAADAAMRKEMRRAAKQKLTASNTPVAAAEQFSELAGLTQHALVQITCRVKDAVSTNSDPAALAIAYYTGKGSVVSYPAGNGQHRTFTYTSGTPKNIARGLRSLAATFQRGNARRS